MAKGGKNLQRSLLEPDAAKVKFDCKYHTHILLHLFPDKKGDARRAGEGWDAFMADQ